MRIMKLGVAGITLFCIGAYCTSCCNVPEPARDPANVVVHCADADGGSSTEPFDAAAEGDTFGAKKSPCYRACANLAKLGCKQESEKPAGGKTCLDTCNDIKLISSFKPECVASAASQDDVRKCPQATCTP